MVRLTASQLAQIVLITTIFVLHLITFYDLSMDYNGSMVIFETSVYGIYFIIAIGCVIAILFDGSFAPPVDAMTKLYGAVFFNVLGIITFRLYLEKIIENAARENHWFFGLAKGVCDLAICILYYAEIFRA